LVPGVSSGEFGKVKATLSNGEIYQADVFFTYTLMSSHHVVVAIVLIGITLPDGHFTCFSEKYSFKRRDNHRLVQHCRVFNNTASAYQETAFAHAQASLMYDQNSTWLPPV